MITIDLKADLRPLVGTEVAVSQWVAVDQSRIDAFAEVTDDPRYYNLALASHPYGRWPRE